MGSPERGPEGGPEIGPESSPELGGGSSDGAYNVEDGSVASLLQAIAEQADTLSPQEIAELQLEIVDQLIADLEAVRPALVDIFAGKSQRAGRLGRAALDVAQIAIEIAD